MKQTLDDQFPASPQDDNVDYISWGGAGSLRWNLGPKGSGTSGVQSGTMLGAFSFICRKHRQ